MRSKFLSIAAAAAVLIGMSALGHAQSSGQRLPRGSEPGQPGASGYTPGHRMQQKGSRAGEPGASGYAPAHEEPSTTGRGSMGGRDPERGRGDER